MDFNLTEDRQMLADTLARYLDDQYPVEHRNKVAYDLPCHDAGKWGELAELGVLGALASEDVGGFGGTGFDIAVVFEALGRALNPEPMLAVAMASRLLAAAGVAQDDLLDGSTHYAVALSEADAPYHIADIETVADGDGKISGRKTTVYGGQVAQKIIVAAKASGQINLYLVNAADANVVGYPMMDGGGAAEVLMDGVKGELILENAGSAIQDALNAGIVALCAEAVGLMSVTHDVTVDYLKQRKQFGRPIGTFQVLQHRAVDMLTEIEQARSITIKAAAELDGPDAARYASMAKNMIGRAGRLIAEEAIQMHGGIAMTWEYPISHYAKRLIMLDAQLGDTDYHLAQTMTALAS